jgi:hypothetical protein
MGDLSASFRRTFPARLWLEYPQRVPPWFHALEAAAVVGMPAIVIGALFARSRLRHHWYRNTGIFAWRGKNSGLNKIGGLFNKVKETYASFSLHRKHSSSVK